MGTAAMAHIALLASRLPWFLGGVAPANAGAGSGFQMATILLNAFRAWTKKALSHTMLYLPITSQPVYGKTICYMHNS